MDAVIVEEYGTAASLDDVAVEFTVRAHHTGVHRNAAIGNADLLETQHLRETLGQRLVERYAFRPQGGLILIA